MRRILERDVNFIGAERMRLQQLLDGKISDQKRKEINQKLNILSAFNIIEKAQLHTELWIFPIQNRNTEINNKHLETRIKYEIANKIDRCLFLFIFKLWFYEQRMTNVIILHLNISTFNDYSFICFVHKQLSKRQTVMTDKQIPTTHHVR